MRIVPLSLLAATLAVVPARAQEATVAVADAEFRAEPEGALLATVAEGTAVALGDARPGWREAVLEGWIWAPSVREDARAGHDLSVAADGGENLRATPNGRILARLREGMLLDRAETRGSWIRVRRAGWLTDAAVSDAGAANAPAGAPDSGRWVRAGQRGTALLGAPEGDTIGRVRPLAAVEVVSRDGNWARVRVEGWVWTPALASPADSGSVLEDVTPEMLASNPAAFQGRLVEWTVQFIALDEADEIRRDLYAGEPFILARAPGDQPGFVYVAVPPDLVPAVRRLTPLEQVTVLARVRTGRSSVMNAPVLELLELR